MSNQYRSWEQLSDLERAECTFSDMYKDAYGFRPRGVDTSGWTMEDFEAEFGILQDAINRDEQDRILRESQAIIHFERRLQELVKLGAQDRATAIRWCMGADEADDHDRLCYRNHLPYGYFQQQA